MKTSQLLSGALLAVAANAQQSLYGQCAGLTYNGGVPVACASGLVCTYFNDYYSQCLAGTAATTSTAKTTSSTSKTSTLSTSTVKASTASTTSKSSTSSTTSKTTTSTSAAATGFKWLGVDESGAEFGSSTYPGVWGTHFIFPSTTALDTLMAEGYNTFRVPFAMERMAPTSLTGTLSAAYLANYSAIITHITDAGGWAIVDPHNFGRYNGAIITDYAAFGTFWANLAATWKTNSRVIFDTNNEYHDEDQTLVFNMNQAAINSIRGIGATSQYIFVEGNSYSGAWTWTSVNTNLGSLTDSSNKIVYEMHQYLDSDGSGTSDACVSTTIGVERVTAATAWLKANGKQGIIGEFAGGANSQCLTAVKGMLDHLKANSDVWLGALWWGGGPWWGTYIFAFEPPSSIGYNYYDATLKTYAP